MLRPRSKSPVSRIISWAVVATFQSRSVPSAPLDARVRPSEENATRHTRLECPASVACRAPVSVSHSEIVLAKFAVASRRPSGEKATSSSDPVSGAPSVRRTDQVPTSQIRAVRS